MAIVDVLLQLASYPDPTSEAVIDRAVDWVDLLGARVTGLSFDVRFQNPNNALADRLVGLSATIADEQARIAAVAGGLLDRLEATAGRRGLYNGRLHERCLGVEAPEVLVEEARLHDLTVIPLPQESDNQAGLAEAVMFGSGRPCLILPEPVGRPAALDTVVVAWDFSRPAARAVHDALPVLCRAKRVRILTVTGEKPIRSRQTPADLVRHLDRHGIAGAVAEEVAAGGRPIGAVLDAYLKTTGVDLLVMGAFGHSRMREFVLGGATRGMLRTPAVPTFFSH